jgi:ABC-type branched-subunit amino acid transport system substrate-binding protein
MTHTSPDPEQNLQTWQAVTGKNNQVIGWMSGCIVVYGNIIINQSSKDSESQKESSHRDIDSNPYKGLLAFHETDGDRFFGRDPQIKELWEKFRNLHENEPATRVLTIFGPSGSGKSSLARAGLIPELAREPLPGRDRARVAVMVPGSHPLEALATVLARIATEDATPVAKTREFAAELKEVNSEGIYDGLRRIGNALPEIADKPLIVLVDQLEEVFTLCEGPAERDAFVGNLLCAAADRSKRVSAIVTLRSDFLGATQKYPLLNQLIASQGYLVAAMSPEGLREAITKPAKMAGHPIDLGPIDLGTVDLLIEQTEGREGALPLLQFALARIWVGLTEGKEPAQTLSAIGGVGGALAGEAQRIYESLSSEEQEIARRIFLGLVQLGEGLKDTRRRTELARVVAHRDSIEQVKRVISRFSAPSARLIALAEDGGTETAEVTHEALFDHWQHLHDWIETSRADLRIRRRLDEATIAWEKNGRLEENLWRVPADLDLLRQYHERASDDMTELQVEFFDASTKARRQRQILAWIERVGLVLTSAGIIIAITYPFLIDKYHEYAYCPLKKDRLGEKVGKDACFRNLRTSGDKIVFFSSSNFHLQKGIEAFREKKFEKAKSLFSQAVDGDRSDPISQIFLNNANARLHGKSLKLAVVSSVDYYETAAKELLRGVADGQSEFNQKQNKTKSPLMEIVIVNDSNEPEAAKRVALELVNTPDILGIIGHHSSESTAAAEEIYKNTKIAIVSSTSSSSELTDKQFFRTIGNTKKAAKKYVDYIRNVLGLKKIFIFYRDKSVYSRRLMEDIKSIFPKKGEPKFNNKDTYNLGSDEFNIDNAINRIKGNYKAALVLSDVQTNSIAIAIIRKNAALPSSQKLKLFGAMSLTEEDTIKRGGAAMNGLTLAMPCMLQESKHMKYAAKKWLQQEISWRTATSYDAIQVFSKAIELSKNNVSRENILRQLQSQSFSLDVEKTSGFGLTWDLSDRSNANRKYCFVQIRKNKFIEIH